MHAERFKRVRAGESLRTRRATANAHTHLMAYIDYISYAAVRFQKIHALCDSATVFSAFQKLLLEGSVTKVNEAMRLKERGSWLTDRENSLPRFLASFLVAETSSSRLQVEPQAGRESGWISRLIWRGNYHPCSAQEN